MSGVQTETTADAGGGQDVAWIDYSDWMDYSINPSAAGTYTVNFRVASPNSNAQFQIRKADGTVLATVNAPNTGGFQTWQTVSASVSLSSGQQTLRVISTGGGGWNFNWMDFVSGTLASIAANTSSSSSLSISPATTQDKFVLQVNNNYTGNMDVQIIDVSGVVKKDFPMTKDVSGSIQTYLSIGDLTGGTYTVRVTMLQWSDSKQIVKQ
jgi:endoglucanase